MRKPKTPVVKKEFALTVEQLYWLRGTLMAKLRKEVTWIDFCRYIGISRRHLLWIRTGERRPGKKLFSGILGLREYGVMVHMSDFEVDPTPE